MIDNQSIVVLFEFTKSFNMFDETLSNAMFPLIAMIKYNTTVKIFVKIAPLFIDRNFVFFEYPLVSEYNAGNIELMMKFDVMNGAIVKKSRTPLGPHFPFVVGMFFSL